MPQPFKLLESDMQIVELALDSWLNGVKAEVKVKELKGHALSIVEDSIEQAERLHERIKQFRGGAAKKEASQW